MKLTKIGEHYYGCGAGKVFYLFELDKPAAKDGYLVCRVERTTTYLKDIRADTTTPKCLVPPPQQTWDYLEAWFVPAGSTEPPFLTAARATPVPPSLPPNVTVVMATDHSGFADKPGTKGVTTELKTIRFYDAGLFQDGLGKPMPGGPPFGTTFHPLDFDAYSSQSVGSSGQWAAVVTHPPLGFPPEMPTGWATPGQVAHVPIAGRLPTYDIEALGVPGFWSDSDGVQGEASATLALRWNCCDYRSVDTRWAYSDRGGGSLGREVAPAVQASRLTRSVSSTRVDFGAAGSEDVRGDSAVSLEIGSGLESEGPPGLRPGTGPAWWQSATRMTRTP